MSEPTLETLLGLVDYWQAQEHHFCGCDWCKNMAAADVHALRLAAQQHAEALRLETGSVIGDGMPFVTVDRRVVRAAADFCWPEVTE